LYSEKLEHLITSSEVSLEASVTSSTLDRMEAAVSPRFS
ncbi:uncharacterized, partial [Tachysurus ichikawai]